MEVVGQDVPPVRVAASKGGAREREESREEEEDEGVKIAAQAA